MKLTETDYEDLEDVEYFRLLYKSLDEQSKIDVLMILEDRSGLRGWQLNIVADYCKIERDVEVDDMWWIAHGLPIPKE